MNQVIVTTHEELRTLLQDIVNEAMNTSKVPLASDQYLSRTEAANYLGIGSTKLNSIKNTDPLFPKPYCLGKKIEFKRSELDAWKEQQRKSNI